MLLFASVLVVLLCLESAVLLSEVALWALCVAPACFYLVQLTGISVPAQPELGSVAAAAAIVLLVRRVRRAPPTGPPLRPDLIGAIAIAAAALLGFSLLLWDTLALPGLDATVIPAYAKLLHRHGRIPDDLWPLGTAAFVYPPGYPMLVTTGIGFGQPLLALVAFKLIHVVVMALTPLVWGVNLRRLFGFGALPLVPVLLAFYVGFFLFDRTLTFAVEVKQAQLLCAFLYPFVLRQLLDTEAGRAQRGLACLAALGLCLIHYSALHMLAIGLCAWLLVTKFAEWRRGLAAVATFGVAVALLLPHLLGAVAGEVELSPAARSLPERLAYLWRLVSASPNRMFSVFEDAGIAWPHKNLAVLAVAALGLGLAHRAVRIGRPGAAAMRRVLAFGLVALAMSLGLAAGLIPEAGIDWRYTRWILYNFTAAVAAVVSLQLWAELEAWLRPRGRRAAWGVGLLAAAGLAVPAARDVSVLRESIREDALDWAALDSLGDRLRTLAQGRDCLLVTESSRTIYWKTEQRHRPLEYAYLISDCSVLNGSWLAPPLSHSRKTLGLPSEEFYASRNAALPGGAGARPVLIALASPDLMQRYRAELPQLRWRDAGVDLGPLRAYVLAR